MKSDAWLERGLARWNALLAASRERRSGRRSHAELAQLVDGYHTLPHDIAQAQARVPDSPLAESLRALYLDLHERLFQPAQYPRAALKNWWTQDIPRAFWAMRHAMLIGTLVFLLSGAIGWALVSYSVELAPMFLSEGLIRMVEDGKLWTDNLYSMTPPSVLSTQITTNNIGVALFAFALGTIYGLGTLYILGLNGLMLGGTFAFVAHHGLAEGLFRFVIAHGCVELSVIVMAGAAGLHIGDALVNPGERTRERAFAEAVRTAVPVVAFGVLALLGCGLIEGYISPNPAVSMGVRIGVGVGFWLLFALVLIGPWRRKA